MTQDTYKVILSGKLLKNETMENVKNRMAALFKTSASVIEKLFERKNAVIKKDLSFEKATRYVTVIEKAGAACYVKKMATPAEKTVPSPKNPIVQDKVISPEAPAASGLKVIPVQTAYKGEDRFFPEQVVSLTASSSGLNFNKDSLIDVSYSKIAALAAYSPVVAGNESNGETILFLVFLKDMERPFVMDAHGIDYPAFQDNPPSKPAGAFRGFLHFLCRQNPSMILEETTFDFLSGNTLPRFDNEKAMKYATAIGMMIEEGGEGEEG